MRGTSIAIRVCTFPLLLVGLTAGGQGLAESSITIGSDGWYSWRVAAYGGQREWCCGQWSMGKSTQTGCDLDGRSSNLTIMEPDEYEAGEMQLYTLLDAGKPIEVRTLSPQCVVKSDRPISDLGLIATDVSLNWLQKYIEPPSAISSDVLAAMAVHEGTRARDVLVSIASSDKNIEYRKGAIEWLGLVRIGETRDVIRQLVFEKDNSEIQEEAILALSQLSPDEAARELIAIIEKSDLDMEIRKMALFSLAQMDSDLVISYISDLVAGD